jgi:predicted ATPase/DNA-binding CsgD family transcriptional regulator
VWLVELAELRDPALVGHAVMAALDLRDQAAAEPIGLLRAYLRDKRVLLVVDNCEHLLDAAARLVGDLIRAAPGVYVIATSREPLSVAGEHVLPVPPLHLPAAEAAEPLARLRGNEAVRLFTERAAAASGGFELTDANQAAVVELCRRLDGLPLAIELAAVRIRALSPQQIRDRLRDRFDLLTGGSRAALARHHTLRTTIEWSYDLLAPAERTLLARLCVFAGRFTLEDVEQVCGRRDPPAGAMLDLLSSLLDKSLVMREEATEAAACYRLQETMREYARLKLREAGEEEAVELSCAEHYLSRSRQFAVEGRHRLLDWLAWMDLQTDNVRAALRGCLDRGDHERGIDLAAGLVWYWVTRAVAEGVRWLDELLARPTEPAAHPWAYYVRGFLAVLQSDPAAAMPVLERGVAAARAAGVLPALSQSLAMASIAAKMAADHAASARLLDEAAAAAEGLEDVGTTLMLYQARALNGLVDGELGAVRSAAAAGVRLSREVGDLYSLGMMLMNQGFAALRSGELPEAERQLTEGLRIARWIDDRVAQCYMLGALGCCAAGAGRPGPAAQLLGAMENLRAELGAAVNAGMAPAFSQAGQAATAALGSAAFAAQFAAGQGLTREAANRLALREAVPSGANAAAPGGNAVPPGGNAAARDDSGVLGRREAEVARLVTDGLSNKEIGARLFISERTVESHVRNILIKLGFSSRAQIAGWLGAADHPA